MIGFDSRFYESRGLAPPELDVARPEHFSPETEWSGAALQIGSHRFQPFRADHILQYYFKMNFNTAL